MNRRWTGAAAVLIAGAVACDVPSAPPILEQVWVVPGEEITMSVGELLPADVALTPDSSAFEMTVSGVSFSELLTDLCTTCSAVDGQVVAKPAFTATFGSSTDLPTNVASASIADGTLVIDMTQDFGFDPLRPVASDPTVTGYMIITVTAGTVEVARDSIDGADVDGAFPSGTTKTVTLPMSPVEVSQALAVDVTIFSPAGDPYTVDSSAGFDVTLNPSVVEIGSAEVQVPDVNVDTDPETLDLAGVDSVVIERVVEGALRVDVQNPLDVQGSLTVTLTPPFQPAIQKTLTIQQGTYSQRLAFTGDELGSILGQDDVTFAASGVLTTAGGTITVTPSAEILMDTEVELTVQVGGEEQP